MIEEFINLHLEESRRNLKRRIMHISIVGRAFRLGLFKNEFGTLHCGQ